MEEDAYRGLIELEVEHEARALAADLEANRVPPNAHRAMSAEEIHARVNFAGIANEAAVAAAAVSQALGAQRQRFLALLRADLAALGSVDAIVNRIQNLQALGINSIEGAPALLAASIVELKPLIEELIGQAATRVRAEAASQGVSLPVLSTLTTSGQSGVDRHVNRLSVLPHNDALRAIAEMSIQLISASPTDRALGLIDQAGRRLSEKPLDDLASQATAGITGLARTDQAETDTQHAVDIYASELIESRTICGPCSLVDGTHYDSIQALRRDYPFGIYCRCEGGNKCRGTPVFVWRTERPADI